MISYLQIIDPLEQDKFEILYKSYRHLMFYIANQILNNPQDAEDAVHSAFLAIANNLDKISDPICPKTKGYLVTIVERKAIDLYRHKKQHPNITLDTLPDENVAIYHSTDSLGRCFSLLPTEARHILLLKYHYGYTASEIAKLLHITESNAAKRIQRAKKQLEALCKEEELL